MEAAACADTTIRMETWRTEDRQIKCILSAKCDAPISNYTLCFSMLAPCEVIEGATVKKMTAGYIELGFDRDVLGTGQALAFTLKYKRSMNPSNCSWLPKGAYLRMGDGSIAPVQLAPRGIDQTFTTKLPEQQADPASRELMLVPAPQSWQPSGDTLDVSAGYKLDRSWDAEGEAESTDAVEALSERNNIGPFLCEDGVALRFAKNEELAEDAYELAITSEGITLSVSAAAGAFYGSITLLNLKLIYGGTIPCGQISDAPRFEWRGQHLDCARHYYEPETLLRLVDMLALFKLNRFHWHFCDDEAFRLEVESYSELWKKSGMRGEGRVVPGIYGAADGPQGGTYSKAFAKRLVDHAKALNIEILPEIEVPAHSWAVLQIHPELRDAADESGEVSVHGYLNNTINPALPEAWTYMEALAKEISGIFPFAHLHLGCDERPPAAWTKSPAIEQLKAEQGLKTADDVQGWMMDKLALYVRSLGVRPAAWEEAAKGANGGINNDAILFSWTQQGPGLEAARKGYSVVMTPAAHAYWDIAPSGNFNEIGLNWAGITSLADSVSWDPVPENEPELESKIIGAQGCLWSEVVLRDANMETMMAPRILGISEIGWATRANKPDADEITQKAACYSKLFSAIGWRQDVRD
ncbi:MULTISPECIES: family 20 glycosylhydrolase [unclassified Pseudovibrio]|uniref:beta-N-acetylhexosaminidase n=1 Tax=unclassified Pseudovibrio TaxID=2627060 RepID=UPI0007AE50AE|nr:MULTISPECIES: family 20 glycosylhydrolase [unclassified Pseudovibrio]KZK94335.1 Beta-hexosaminidase [Pseudovibrio sp. W74]KZL09851.1 Beta-hexosaminidase [Pseudovibrio sp. Ad14]